jgi:hypothetical protein
VLGLPYPSGLTCSSPPSHSRCACCRRCQLVTLVHGSGGSSCGACSCSRRLSCRTDLSRGRAVRSCAVRLGLVRPSLVLSWHHAGGAARRAFWCRPRVAVAALVLRSFCSACIIRRHVPCLYMMSWSGCDVSWMCIVSSSVLFARRVCITADVGNRTLASSPGLHRRFISLSAWQAA